MPKIRYILLSILCMFALSGSAKHLAFMGIPINGTISTFQTKLSNKGCKVSNLNYQLPSGIRMFTGVFAGNDSEIFVYFNTKTKIVYKVRVLVKEPSLDIARSTFDYYKNLLSQKYEDVCLTSDMLEDNGLGDYEFEFLIFSTPLQEGAQLSGIIDLDVYEYDDYEYAVRLDYTDYENAEKNEGSVMDDL